MPRLYREAPLTSIWEGSGNVMGLDVLRALSRCRARLRSSSRRSNRRAAPTRTWTRGMRAAEGAVLRHRHARDEGATRGRRDGPVPSGLAARAPLHTRRGRRLLRRRASATTGPRVRHAPRRRGLRASSPAAAPRPEAPRPPIGTRRTPSAARRSGRLPLTHERVPTSSSPASSASGSAWGSAGSSFCSSSSSPSRPTSTKCSAAPHDRLPGRRRLRAALLRLAHPARARSCARRAPQRPEGRSASTCGHRRDHPRQRTDERAAMEFRVAAAGPLVTCDHRPLRPRRQAAREQQRVLRRRVGKEGVHATPAIVG